MIEGLRIDRFHEIKKARCDLDFKSKPETRFHRRTNTKGDPTPLTFEVIWILGTMIVWGGSTPRSEKAYPHIR